MEWVFKRAVGQSISSHIYNQLDFFYLWQSEKTQRESILLGEMFACSWSKQWNATNQSKNQFKEKSRRLNYITPIENFSISQINLNKIQINKNNNNKNLRNLMI